MEDFIKLMSSLTSSDDDQSKSSGLTQNLFLTCVPDDKSTLEYNIDTLKNSNRLVELVSSDEKGSYIIHFHKQDNSIIYNLISTFEDNHEGLESSIKVLSEGRKELTIQPCDTITKVDIEKFVHSATIAIFKNSGK
ncbi:hypothetical protein FACS189465_3440 [Clostridia bacterium]|nr:hypothetical protein FACS189465_3440 [Clostridia bacterium]